MTGSSRTGPASRAAAWAPIEPAIWKAISLESSSWKLPPVSVTATSITG